jgi:hypothetical protein
MTGTNANWVPGVWAGDNLPPHIAALCSEFWGALSFHARVFSVPMRIEYVHCNGCHLPTTPSGARILDGVSTTRKQTERACRRIRALLEDAAAPLYVSPEKWRAMNEGLTERHEAL